MAVNDSSRHQCLGSFFQWQVSEYTDALDAALVEGVVAIGILILLEVLQGFKNEKEYHAAKTSLGTLDQLPTVAAKWYHH